MVTMAYDSPSSSPVTIRVSTSGGPRSSIGLTSPVSRRSISNNSSSPLSSRKFRRDSGSGRFLSFSKDSTEEFVNYTVHIPQTPDNRFMSDSQSSPMEDTKNHHGDPNESFMTDTTYTGGFNSATRSHVRGKSEQEPAVKKSKMLCEIDGCDAKAWKNKCECEFRICDECFLECNKNGAGLCPGCKEPYNNDQTDEDDERDRRRSEEKDKANSLPRKGKGVKLDRKFSMVRSFKAPNTDFDHNKWLYETKGTYGFGNAFWPRNDYEFEQETRGYENPPGNERKNRPLTRKVWVSTKIISPYRLLMVIRLAALCCFLTWRIANPNHEAMWLWIISVICEIWFAVSWILDQLPKVCPVKRVTDLSVLKERFEPSNGLSDLPGIDVFVSTADADKEPPLVTATTILSILAVDYPVEKVACYLSDDGGSLVTFEALAEAASFARLWVPFCRKYRIEPRNPEAYFGQKGDPLKNMKKVEFVRERRRVKREYDEFKVRINALPESIRRRSDALNAREGQPLSEKVSKATFMSDGRQWHGTWSTAEKGHSRGDHEGIVQVTASTREKHTLHKGEKSEPSGGGKSFRLSGIDVDADGNEEDGDEAKVDDGVDKDRNPARLHITELHHSPLPRNLIQQPWRQQHEQHHRHHHRPPIRHFHSISQSRRGEEESLIDMTGVDTRLSLLVYVSREKRPGYDHNKKAGAMNALVRASAILSNGPFILNLDCDHYIYNTSALREGMCFMLDRGGDKICYIQFPQRFEGIDPNDRYANHNTVFFDVSMRALDGLQGPMYVGTGCIFRRTALYGFSPPRATEHHGWFGRRKIKIRLIKRKPPVVEEDEEEMAVPIIEGQNDDDELARALSTERYGNSIHLMNSIPVAEFGGRLLHGFQGEGSRGRKAGSLAVRHEPIDRATLPEAITVISCFYEDKTDWGKRVGWIYGSITEDVVTGYRMHNRGWRSIYCVTKRDAFRGTAPINLTDRLVQVLRWATGSVEIFFSRNSALFATRRMKFLQRVAYFNVGLYPFTSFFLLAYCVVPALSLFSGKFIVQSLNVTFLSLLLVMTLTLCMLAALEIKWSGITLHDWWRNEQFWLIGGTSAHPAAVIQALLKVIAGYDTSFTLTSKPATPDDVDDEFAELYAFRYTSLMIPPVTIILLNITAIAMGTFRTFYSPFPEWSKLLGGVFFSFWVLSHLYPFGKGLMGRKGKIPTIVYLWATLICIVVSLLFSFINPPGEGRYMRF
ncbi:hypothetical protein RJ639_046909 [Escallonia herrerae]|uniref:Cellulose synthase-like protein D5 n=1 Tax=Escallonia herrerae TaxID=1293975 RepID=A0AA88W611_9ASTE|nr:hypothetical protein RJ639_046909 [Escallonia herrerae]